MRSVERNLFQANRFTFSDCDAEFVSETMKNSSSVNSIDISYSAYEFLSKIYIIYETLTEFNASHNKLTEIPKRFFENVDLIRVDLSCNQLEAIELNNF